MRLVKAMQHHFQITQLFKSLFQKSGNKTENRRLLPAGLHCCFLFIKGKERKPRHLSSGTEQSLPSVNSKDQRWCQRHCQSEIS